MISAQTMQKIDALWNTLLSSGMRDSLVNVEQVSYLIFFKRIDSVQIKKEQMAAFWEMDVADPIFDALFEDCRWSRFKLFDAERLYRHMSERVFPFVHYNLNVTSETSYARYMRDAVFHFSDPAALKSAVEIIDELDFDTAENAKETYEYLLQKIITNADMGQFATPDFLVELMVKLTAPTIEDKICDPAMGTANLLAAAARYVYEHDSAKLIDQKVHQYYSSEMFCGIDIDHQMVSIAAMLMTLSEIPEADLQRMDALSANNYHSDEYSLVLSSPPFSIETDVNYVSESLQGGFTTGNTAVLFYRLIMRILRPLGRAAIIVPDVLLFGVRKANIALKQEMLAKHRIDAIISLSSRDLQYFGRTSCSLLLLTKEAPGGTDQVWFYDLREAKDIPDLLERFANKAAEEKRSRFDQSFLVSREEIENNNYMLIMNRYQKDAALPVHASSKMAVEDLKIANSILKQQLFRLEES